MVAVPLYEAAALEVVSGAFASMRNVFEVCVVSLLAALSAEYQLNVCVPSPLTVNVVPVDHEPPSIW